MTSSWSYILQVWNKICVSERIASDTEGASDSKNVSDSIGYSVSDYSIVYKVTDIKSVIGHKERIGSEVYRT